MQHAGRHPSDVTSVMRRTSGVTRAFLASTRINEVDGVQMRRQNIQLLSAARQGDVAARCEAGRRYLLGIEGFPKHVQTGLAYLTHSSLRNVARAAIVMAENLPLEALVRTPQRDALRQAAQAGSTLAQLRLAAWEMTRPGGGTAARAWIAVAADRGSPIASDLRALWPAQADLLALLRLLSKAGVVDGGAVADAAASEACAERDLPRLVHCLHAALALAGAVTPPLAELVSHAVGLAEDIGEPIALADPALVQSCLEYQSHHDDCGAAYALGRALAGVPCGCLEPARLAPLPNLRKGTALLLRAADGGREAAWLHLFRLHADHRSSVANPQMARFFLEKAAAGGQAEGQRKLGALLLREADCVADTERAIHWLFQASTQHDEHARELLRSLVLPLEGPDDEALAIIDEVQREDPWLAQRLRLSRHFGLTKLEALTVDPSEGERPWGLTVGRNPFIVQARRGAPRAVPAMTAHALEDLKAMAAFFDRTRQDGSGLEGDLRRRSHRQRILFEKRGLDE
ncbi:MAG TPA: hypothetical protein VGP22_02805, partial [Albitalea sp.]|nr:hypothetical protein [Albitalea sp.]